MPLFFCERQSSLSAEARCLANITQHGRSWPHLDGWVWHERATGVRAEAVFQVINCQQTVGDPNRA